MACSSGPNVVTSNLVFDMDGANRKGFSGYGIERIGGITPQWNAWAGIVGTSVSYVSKTGSLGVLLTVTTAGGVNYWISNTGGYACSASTVYVVTGRIKSSNTPSANLFYVRQYNSVGAQTSEAGYFSASRTTPVGDDGFYTAWGYFTTDSTATSFYIHGYEYDIRTIYLEDVQCKLAGIQNIVSPGTMDGILYNGASYTSANNGVMSFDGSNDYLGSNSNPTIAFTGGAMEMWIKLTTNGINQGFFSFAASGAYIDFYMTSGNTIRWEVIGTTSVGYATIWSTTAFSTGIWYHVVGSFDSATTTLYINGVQEATQTMGNQPGSITAQAIVGQYAGYSPSSIGTVKLYNKPLTATEVKQNFQALRGRFEI